MPQLQLSRLATAKVYVCTSEVASSDPLLHMIGGEQVEGNQSHEMSFYAFGPLSLAEKRE